MQHNRHILLLLIHAALFSISLCENINPNYANCVETFRCGSFSNLSYPFWGGARPLSCGYPGFHLDCGGGDGDAPLLSISSLSYRLLHINFSSHTLKVARQDLWNDTCPKIIRNTSLDPNLFQIPPHLNHANITLSFNCTSGGLRHDGAALGNFSCGGVSGVATINSAADASSGDWISVPVATDTRTASTTNALRDALVGGFFIRWSAEDTSCEDCRRSGGACGYDLAAGTAACYKKSRGRSIQVGAATASPAAAARAQVAAAPTASPSRRSSAKVWKIIGIVVGVIGTHILTAAVVCYIRRRCMERCPNHVCDPDVEKFLLQQGSLASKRYKYSEIKKMTNSFNHKLGQGGYGTVYKGMLPDGCPVAVKVLVDANGDGENGEEFMNEVASISRTSHVNIVNLLGFCYEGSQQRALVYEFMPNKSLDKFLSKNDNLGRAECGLDTNSIYAIAVGVAKGLEYLHTGCNTRIVHFDIKPQNILLDQEFCPKISDFGLAKLCRKKQSVLSVIGARGTVGYIAPEVFSRNFGGVSHKSDVYSYGMMLLEMAGATVGVYAESEEEVRTGGNYFPDKSYEQVVASIDHVGEEEEEEITRKMMLTGFWCIQTMPSERPSMSKVVEMLEGSLKSLQIPPKPTLFIQTLAARREISSFFTSSSLQTEAEIALEVQLC